MQSIHLLFLCNVWIDGSKKDQINSIPRPPRPMSETQLITKSINSARISFFSNRKSRLATVVTVLVILFLPRDAFAKCDMCYGISIRLFVQRSATVSKRPHTIKCFWLLLS